MAGWLGIGQDNVDRACRRTWTTRSIWRRSSRPRARRSPAGKKIAAIVATMGSTDAFGIDDLRAIDALRDRLVDEFSLAVRAARACRRRDRLGLVRVQRLRLPAATRSAFAAGRCGRWPRRSTTCAHLRLADSIGIDFHKTGYTPYISSLVLVRDAGDFDLIAREPRDDAVSVSVGRASPGHVHAGNDAQRHRARWRRWPICCCFGKEGYRTLLGHAVEMAEVLRELIESHPNLTVLNGENVGPVTLFRAYPDGVDTFSVKDRERSDPALSRSSCWPTTNTTAASSSACTPKRWRARAW